MSCIGGEKREASTWRVPLPPALLPKKQKSATVDVRLSLCGRLVQAQARSPSTQRVFTAYQHQAKNKPELGAVLGDTTGLSLLLRLACILNIHCHVIGRDVHFLAAGRCPPHSGAGQNPIDPPRRPPPHTSYKTIDHDNKTQWNETFCDHQKHPDNKGIRLTKRPDVLTA